MNKNFLLGTLLYFVTAVPAAMAQGTAYDDPAGQGVPVKSVVQVGPMNTNNYDVTVTLLETVRGRQALQRLKAVDAKAGPPRAGFEYQA